MDKYTFIQNIVYINKCKNIVYINKISSRYNNRSIYTNTNKKNIKKNIKIKLDPISIKKRGWSWTSHPKREYTFAIYDPLWFLRARLTIEHHSLWPFNLYKSIYQLSSFPLSFYPHSILFILDMHVFTGLGFSNTAV